MMPKKVVIITGASSGIGKATATYLNHKGLKVYALARNMSKMEDLKSQGIIPISVDLSNDDLITKAVELVRKLEKRIDVLINNAGYGVFGSIEETSIEDAKREFEVNLFGLARLTQLIIPNMRKRKSGQIINLTSIGGRVYSALGAWYYASKHALEGWSDCLRYELSPYDIKVTIIEPGLTQSSFRDVMIKPMMERSGEGVYKKIAKAVKKFLEKADREKKGTDPIEVSKTIFKAINSSNPKTRYVVGAKSKKLLLLRKWLGDRYYDSLLRKQFGL